MISTQLHHTMPFLLPHPSHTATSNKIECKDTVAKFAVFVSSYVLRFF